MKKNRQAGFIPLIIALIAALSFGGGVIAYKSAKHRKEAKIEEQSKTGIEFKEEPVVGNKMESSNLKPSSSLRIKNSEDNKIYGEDRKGEFGDDGEEDDDRGGVRTPPIVVTPPPVTSGTGTTVKSYTMTDVKTHNTSASCWTAVNGSVYDVTSWIGQHPGGAGAIKGMCGIDGSAAFNGQHGGQARPASELASFKIGILK